MRDIADKQDNTAGATGELTAAEYNDHKNELQNFVESTGQTLDINKTPDQFGRAGFIYGTAAQTMQDAAPSANVIELTPITGASGLIVPDAYSTMDGLIVEFDKVTANTSTTVTINFGQTSITLLGAKSLKTKLGLDPGIGIVTGRCRIQFDVGNDWWILLDSDFAGAEETIESLYLSGGNVTLDESILFGSTITQQNLGSIGGLTASSWYFVVIREDTLAVSLQALSSLSPSTFPASWTPTLASNQLDMSVFYDKDKNYCWYDVSSVNYRILYAFKTNSTPDNFEPNAVIRLKNKPYTNIILANSVNQNIPNNTEVYFTFTDIYIDLLSEISGASTARVFTGQYSDLTIYDLDYAAAINNDDFDERIYYNGTLYREKNYVNNASNEDHSYSTTVNFNIAKGETLELKLQKGGGNSVDINGSANAKSTMLTILASRGDYN